jgi:DNA-3-methyladenine glycosylase II
MDIFTENQLKTLCDDLVKRDNDLQDILTKYGYPPLWSRQNTYETLVHIILEQQVSLASAAATLEKLRRRVGTITPESVLALSNEELREATFSRQKTAYVKHLSDQIINRHIILKDLESLSSDEIRQKLIALKGIGNWTIDIYLIMVLHRTDVFPAGDLAAMNALRVIKKRDKTATRESLLSIVEQWAPFRTIGTMLLWHYYLSVRKKSETAPPV